MEACVSDGSKKKEGREGGRKEREKKEREREKERKKERGEVTGIMVTEEYLERTGLCPGVRQTWG